MKRVVNMHVRHDFVAHLDFVIGHALGGDFRQAQVSFRVDQAGIDRHAGCVDHFSASGDRCARAADSGDPSVMHHHNAVFNHAMRDGQQLAAFQRNGFIGRGSRV